MAWHQRNRGGLEGDELKALPITLIITAIVATLLRGQSITGNVRISGNMQVNIVDNCTTFLCGDTNTLSGSDKNFKQWIVSRMDGVAGTACRVAAVLGTTGTPVGNIRIGVFLDNAGQPGAQLFESNPLDASQIIDDATNNFPGINWVIPAQTLWIGIKTSDPVSLFAVNDYISYYNHYSGVVTDKVYVSDDGLVWVDGGALSFLSIRLLYAQ